jgi:hypothetical protein
VAQRSLDFRFIPVHNPAMRKRVQIALAVLLIAVVGVIGWREQREREPVYRGKPVSYWINRSGEAYELVIFPQQIWPSKVGRCPAFLGLGRMRKRLFQEW